ncbi:MAG TPA: hypothetical protein VM070_08965, partial [Candidatus Saccharimonadales bacterium]|nr:hypothetical protein [Candidatus Saccharimonadales bacterium]
AIVRTVTYRNAGTAPVTLALAAALSGPTGPGVISVSPATLTIPAGGTAATVITAHTDGALANGLYGGALVATGGDVRVETPIGVEREAEHFELTLQLAHDGAPVGGFVIITGADGIPDFRFPDGALTVRLLRGRYAIDAYPDGPAFAFVASPRLDLDADKTVVLDDAGARSFELALGDDGVALALSSLTYTDLTTFHSGSTTGIGVPASAVQAGPDLPPDEVTGTAFATFSDDLFGEAKSIYHLARVERGHVPNGWREVIDRRALATVEAHHAGRADHLHRKGAVPLFDDGVNGLIGELGFFQNVYAGPFDRTERFFGRGFVWATAFVDFLPLPADPGGFARATALRR